ncbi:MAG: hypothetical protein IPK69_02820 [Phycisphaerales bacterium]|nr:MAG: hypothetical protein IPK69_02820 [Phycisphaerales bacterium]
MARTLPKTINGLISFAKVHSETFTQHAGAIGLSPEQAARVADATAELIAKRNEQYAAMETYRAATNAMESARQDLADILGATIFMIRAHATLTGDGEILTTAQIPGRLPARRSAGAPNAAHSLSARLHAATGAITISWKSRQPRGVRSVTWIVERRVQGELGWSEWDILGLGGNRGGRSYTDATVPQGTRVAQYRVTARTGGEQGPESSVLAVNLGSTVDGHGLFPAGDGQRGGGAYQVLAVA